MNRFIIAAMGLVLTACQTTKPIYADDLTIVASPAIEKPTREIDPESIAVTRIDGVDKMPIDDAVLFDALTASLKTYGLAAESGKDAPFSIEVEVQDYRFVNASNGLKSSAFLDAIYRVKRAASEETLIEERVTTDFYAKVRKRSRGEKRADVAGQVVSTIAVAAIFKSVPSNSIRDPKTYDNTPCPDKGEPETSEIYAEVSSSARQYCAERHVIQRNIEEFFSRLLVYKEQA